MIQKHNPWKKTHITNISSVSLLKITILDYQILCYFFGGGYTYYDFWSTPKNNNFKLKCTPLPRGPAKQNSLPAQRGQ